MSSSISNKMLGAEITPQGVHYCTWSPDSERVDVEIGFTGAVNRFLRMESDACGYHRVLDSLGRSGDKYKFRLNEGESFPDPASRAQAEGVHGASRVVDHRFYEWHDETWVRPAFRDLVIYEIHIGTFTSEGTFRAAIDRLRHLRQLGVNAIELMPIGDFPGARNWGYDGVLIYAPAQTYGSPDDLRALVDAAHAEGIAVILDVVYNHFGPDGNYIARYSSAFFNEKHHTPWGAAFNFDGDASQPVRDFFVKNPIYWMEQFHIDGFRLDATHAIIDTSKRHILTDIAGAIHERGGYTVAEDERNEASLVTEEDAGGQGFDAVWADDFHHVIRVSQTGEQAAYFQDFRGTIHELADTLRNGWLYRGEVSSVTKHVRGTECRHLAPSKFIHCISNHDQVGNRAFGERINHSLSPEAYRAISMLLCLTPFTPLLFMGQEWAASTPFLYFTDHNDELGQLVTEGRRREFAGFPEFGNEAILKTIPDPQKEDTFIRSKLHWEEITEKEHAVVLALYKASLGLRRKIRAFRPEFRGSWEVAETGFGGGVLAIRFKEEQTTYLVLFDASGKHSVELAHEPIAGLEGDGRWELMLSSNSEHFDGTGSAFDDRTQNCHFKTQETLVLRVASRAGTGSAAENS